MAVSFNMALPLMTVRARASGCGRFSSYANSEAEFREAKQQSAAYRLCLCDTSFVTSAADSSVQVLQRLVDPSVMAAYISCLQLFSSGIRMTMVSDITDGASFTASVQYVPDVFGGSANITGVMISSHTPQAVSCVVVDGSDATSPLPTSAGRRLQQVTSPAPPHPGPPSPPRPRPPPIVPANTASTAPASEFAAGVRGTFPLLLNPFVVYNIFCQLDPYNRPTDGGYSSIYITNTVAPAFIARLYHKLPANQPDESSKGVTPVRTG